MSSVSAENLSNNEQSNDGSSMCLELALEGERLCKSGDCRAGVAFFQAAIQAGTDDLRTLSAIYSQLGNAYFYLGDYNKAMQYHYHDLTLARTMEDKLGEAKSSGNLGNTLKVMGRFDEAAKYCSMHLTIAQQLGDRLSEGRALYNLGNVYHAKGKHLGQKDPGGDFSEEVKDSLMQAVDYYQQNLSLMREIGDRGAQGRACGNLGNTYYLLGNFDTAIEHHQERLRIAREFGDKAAERRANSNLGNSHIFLGQFEQAATHYKRTLSLAMELGERAVEAQACYSLGNTYTLLRDFPTAIDYHQRHLHIAQELGDRIGEARACWSLGNAHSSIGNHEKALHYATSHFVLAKELGDVVGENTARMNVSDLRKILGLPDLSPDLETAPPSEASQESINETCANRNLSKQFRMRRQSMEQLDLIKLTPDGKKLANSQMEKHGMPKSLSQNENIMSSVKNDDDFFDMLTRSQSKRMDDQRCTLKIGDHSGESRKPLTQQNNIQKDSRNSIIDMIAEFQSPSGRMDEQRAALPGLKKGTTTPAHKIEDDDFIENLIRCQDSRIEDQRSELPRPNITMDAENNDRNMRQANITGTSGAGATVPDEDFFSLIQRLQGGRMEDQRAAIPRPKIPQNTNNNLNSLNNNSKKKKDDK